MIDVALAADEAYAPHAATLLHSLITSNDPLQVTAHVLHPPQLRAKTRLKIQRMVEDAGSSVHFHEIAPSAVQGLPSMGRISEVMWYRLMLPALLPAVDRVLYLDCDTLVLDDLGPLWELDLRTHEIGAVTNVFPQDLLSRPAKLGLPESGYFNSGVLLMNLEAWRTERTAARIVELVRTQPERIVFPDQDALNIVLADRRLALHPRWNCQNSLFYFSWAADTFGADAVAEACAEPAIVHFEGPAQAKPWHVGSTHPHQRTYLDHRSKTPWPKVRFEGKLSARLRRSMIGSAR